MTFDFYQNYQQLPSTELLKIVQTPHDYQPEAVAAAQLVLDERNVSDEEKLQVENYFEALASKAAGKSRPQFLDTSKDGWLEALLHPSENTTAAKWLRNIVLVLSLQYLYSLYYNVRFLKFYIDQFADCRRHGFNGNKTASIGDCIYVFENLEILITLFAMVFIPFMIYLLLKRKKWGWVILFANLVFSLASYGFVLFLSFYHPDMLGKNNHLFQVFLMLGIRIVIAYFLWKEIMAAYFSVSPALKNTTFFISITVSIALQLLTS